MIRKTLRPYLSGTGPIVRVTIDGDHATVKAGRAVVADLHGYRPGSMRGPWGQVDDILCFAAHYAETGDAPDGSSVDRGWWARHGDALTGAIPDRVRSESGDVKPGK